MQTITIVVFMFSVALGAFGQGGMPLWTNRYDGPVGIKNYASAVAVDTNIGNVYVTGYSFGISGHHYVTLAYSGTGVPLWTNGYVGPANSDDRATAIAVDGNSGKVYVTGYSYGSSGSDYATIAYSSAGVPLWTNRYNGPGNIHDHAEAIAVDASSGKVFVTGDSYGGSGASLSIDYATVAYSSAGVPLWTNRYNGPDNYDDYAYAIAVDGSDNVCVTGTSPSFNGGSDYATIKYSSAGLPLWTNRYGGSDIDVASAVVMDPSGNVYVTGSSYIAGRGDDYLTIKYSSAGVPMWTNLYNGPGNSRDDASAIAVDRSNNVYVTGRSIGSSGNYNYATINYSSAGVALWTNRYNGPVGGNSYAKAIAVDGNNNVYVTGYSTNSTSGNDYATIAYSSAGLAVWTNRYNGPGNADDQAVAITVNDSGIVYMTGYSIGTPDYGYATIKYSGVSVPPGLMQIQRLGSSVVLTWTNTASGLQSAPAITGTFTNLAGATSPYTNPITVGQKFFRLSNN